MVSTKSSTEVTATMLAQTRRTFESAGEGHYRSGRLHVPTMYLNPVSHGEQRGRAENAMCDALRASEDWSRIRAQTTDARSVLSRRQLVD